MYNISISACTSALLERLDRKDEGATIRRNVGNYIPIDTLSIPGDINLQLHICENLKSHNSQIRIRLKTVEKVFGNFV